MGALKTIANMLDSFADATGKVVCWLTLAMVLVQVAVVLMRYVFGIGSIFMQEAIIYLHASLFLLAGAYTLRHNGHVRVDVFYRTASDKRKALTNLLGTLLFLLPVCWVIFDSSFDYVSNSWAIREGSKETSGIQAVYLLKTLIPTFAVLMALQGVALALHSLLVLLDAEAFEEEDAPEL